MKYEKIAIKTDYHLRILAIRGAKTTENQTPWYALFDYFTTTPFFQNLYDPFLTK